MGFGKWNVDWNIPKLEFLFWCSYGLILSDARKWRMVWNQLRTYSWAERFRRQLYRNQLHLQ